MPHVAKDLYWFIKMNEKTLYYYAKSRKQRAWIFINMAITCFLYIAGLFGYEYYFNSEVSGEFRTLFLVIFTLAALILLCIAMWFRLNPANYLAIITKDRFIVSYPKSKQWSFDVSVRDIKRFEHRNTLSHAGSGIGRTGILLHDGTFHEISMNYGNSINDMYKAIKLVRPDVEFPTKVNKKVEGFLSKDYDR